MDTAPVTVWQRLLQHSSACWVLFEQGTCVVLPQPESDLRAQAVALLATWGSVHPGNASADFSVIEPEGEAGWVVTCHHPDILTYVGPDEFAGTTPPEVVVGLMGRSQREQDAADLQIMHVEDKRGGR